MIFLDVVGRCGNQMFQYAFARKISIVNQNEKISIDFYYVYEDGKQRNDISFNNALNDFKARENFIAINEGGNKVLQYGSRQQVFVFKIFKRLKHFLQKYSTDKRIAEKIMYKVLSYYGIYWYYAPKRIKRCKQKNKFVFGFFEDPQYFNDIQQQLRLDFEPVLKPSKENMDLYDLIDKEESICISIRRWKESEPVNDNWYVCDEQYYQKAINKILELVPNSKLIIFSNDIQWVKDNFIFPCECFFENGNDEIYEKMRLMYSCKHFIISNSTFSWWAQYLGCNRQKIVISPGCWHKNEKNINPLLQEEFQKVGG